ncbi:MAG: hypothetical protein P1V35_12595 [Planctomycetota bacterium]|nr:hypothetical protein [Planctomycetota bacterium]
MAEDTFLIQIGGLAAGTAGVGVLSVSTFVGICDSTDDWYELGLFGNDTCFHRSLVEYPQHAGLYVSKSDSDDYAFCVSGGDTVTIDLLFRDGVSNVDAYLWYSRDVNCRTGASTAHRLDLLNRTRTMNS